MPREKHPNENLEDVVRYAEEKGWIVVSGGRHVGFVLQCSHSGDDRCKVLVWGTPPDTGKHAQGVKEAIERCPHQDEGNAEQGRVRYHRFSPAAPSE